MFLNENSQQIKAALLLELDVENTQVDLLILEFF